MLNFRTTFDETTRTWHGPKLDLIFNPDVCFGSVMFEVLNRSPDRVIQQDMDTGRSMTYADFRTRLIRFAQNITKLGLRREDVVTLANANSENLAPLACALLTIGIPFNPIAPGFNEDDMAHMIDTTNPKMVFCDDNNYEVVRGALQRLSHGGETPPIYVFESPRDDVRHAEDLLKETGQEHQFMVPYLGDSHTTVAAILCTSGTSGAHKGVRMTHAMCTLQTALQFFSPKPEVNFNFSAIYWMTGFGSMLAMFMSGGIRLITRKPFSEELLFEAIERHRASIIFTPPSYANAVLAHPRLNVVDFSSIRMWAVGGSPVPDEVRDRIDALLAPTGGRSVNVFGASEVGGVAVDFLKRKPLAIGPLMPNISVRIVDENGNRLGVGEQGELLMKSNEKPAGYYGNESESALACDPDGFFRSGDIGYLDEEGFLYLVDRRKDIFKYRGFHVSPSDLEVIIHRIDGVRDVCVVGIPDAARTTDLPAAAIVLQPGASAVLDAAQVQNIVDKQVSDFKRLRGGVHFVEDLPRTQSGKIVRRKVAEMIMRLNEARQDPAGK